MRCDAAIPLKRFATAYLVGVALILGILACGGAEPREVPAEAVEIPDSVIEEFAGLLCERVRDCDCGGHYVTDDCEARVAGELTEFRTRGGRYFESAYDKLKTAPWATSCIDGSQGLAQGLDRTFVGTAGLGSSCDRFVLLEPGLIAGGDCVAGLYCTSVGICEPEPDFGVDENATELGAPCSGPCAASDLYCDASGTCQSTHPAGGACEDYYSCVGTAQNCAGLGPSDSGVEGTCAAPGTVGDPCNPDDPNPCIIAWCPRSTSVCTDSPRPWTCNVALWPW